MLFRSFSVTRTESGGVTVSAPTIRPTFVDKAGGCVIRDVLKVLAAPEGYDPKVVKAAEKSLARTIQIIGTGFLAAN